MQKYNYTARDNYGKLVRGALAAEDELDLANKVSNLGCFLLHYKVAASQTAAKGHSVPRMKLKETLNFTIHLSTLLDAGVPMITALKELAQDEDKQNVRRIIEDIRYHVESGFSLKDALVNQSASFSKLYTAVVGAGETTGKLPKCLNELAVLLTWQLELRTRIREAATYPVILFCVMVGVVVLLMVKMIPTFESIFKEMDVALPLPTQVILTVSLLIRKSWYLILGGIGALTAGYKICNSTFKGRYVLDSLKLKMPLFGPLLRKVALSRFCHTFALGLRSGVALLASLDFAAEVIGNSRLRQSVIKARDSVNVGEKLATSFGSSGEFPALIVRMISVGEQSGSLPQTLEKVNEFYDREVPVTIRAIFALFEPIMIVLMAVIVGGIAIAIFLPLFRMAEVIGG